MGDIAVIKRASALFLSALLFFAAPARADESPADSTPLRLPVAHSQRPLTQPKLVLTPQLDFDVRHQSASATYVNLSLGAAFGITDDLTLRTVVLPWQLAGPGTSGFQFGQTTRDRGPGVGMVYRFVRGTVEVGAAVDVRVFTIPDYSGAAIIPSVPVHIHASEDFRIDITPSVNITRATQNKTIHGAPAGSGIIVTSTSDNAVRIDVPVRFVYDIIEPLDIGVNTGLTIYDVSNARLTTGIPLGAFIGYSVAGMLGPVFDVGPFFDFPYLIMPGRTPSTNTTQFILGVNLAGHLYL